MKLVQLYILLTVVYNYNILVLMSMNNHVHRALLENTERMRKEKDKKGNAQKRLTLLNK